MTGSTEQVTAWDARKTHIKLQALQAATQVRSNGVCDALGHERWALQLEGAQAVGKGGKYISREGHAAVIKVLLTGMHFEPQVLRRQAWRY